MVVPRKEHGYGLRLMGDGSGCDRPAPGKEPGLARGLSTGSAGRPIPG